MEIDETIKAFFLEGDWDEEVIIKQLQSVFDSGFNAAVKQAHLLAKDCSVPDSYSQPTVDDLALDIALLKRSM
jgi:hypothetical protein